MARTLTGVVSSDSRDKTITVTVTSRETHPVYKKQFTITRKYSAHDEKNAAHIGDKVVIAEHRPFSKTKTWILAEIIEKSKGKIELKEDVTGEKSDDDEEAA
ncbi:30S ribosomal protein S17 [Candidatus Saccharibacteria bacterium]|nr:30S ribosomal protein S17 [Candidatus Saccharibacteria bacterium]